MDLHYEIHSITVFLNVDFMMLIYCPVFISSCPDKLKKTHSLKLLKSWFLMITNCLLESSSVLKTSRGLSVVYSVP